MASSALTGKKCLVTGGSGFVGSHLCLALLKLGADVTIVDRRFPENPYPLANKAHQRLNVLIHDVSDLEYMKRLVNALKPDFVFHLAAQPLSVPSNLKPYETKVDNIDTTYSVLEAIRTKSPAALIFSSTACYYGLQHESPLNEESSPNVGEFMYTATKIAADFAVRHYASIYNLKMTCCRFVNLYGEGDVNASRIVPQTVAYLLQGKRPELLRDDGQTVLDFMHVSDAVRALIRSAEDIDVAKGKAVNFGTGKPITVIDLVRMISRIYTDEYIEPLVLGSPREPTLRKYLSVERAQKLLKWKAEISLETGLKRTIEWYRQNPSVLLGENLPKTSVPI